MAVYRPTYKDPKTGKKKQQAVWWYHFTFAGKRIQESSKSTRKTVALEAEKKRRAELERGFNAVEEKRVLRISSIGELAASFLEHYRLRNPKSATFAEFALGHVRRHLGKHLKVDINPSVVRDYQATRLKENAAPKSINEETSFLLRLLDEQGDIIRVKMRREKTLKLTTRSKIAKAYDPDQKVAMHAAARERRSPHIVPALALALHVGLRDKEIRTLQWERVDLLKAVVQVGDSKTEASQGRTIPLNSDVLEALKAHARWYLDKFGETRPKWYVFPFGKPQPTDPTRPVTSLKTVWRKVKESANVTGRWHDTRHTFITDLAESGQAGDETIRDIAGHVSQRMLKHYSHIRMDAKRRAVEALIPKKQPTDEKRLNSVEPAKESAKVDRPN